MPAPLVKTKTPGGDWAIQAVFQATSFAFDEPEPDAFAQRVIDHLAGCALTHGGPGSASREV
jgi:hypothetical protein